MKGVRVVDFIYTIKDIGIVPIGLVVLVGFLIFKGLGLGKSNNNSNSNTSGNSSSTNNTPPTPPAS